MRLLLLLCLVGAFCLQWRFLSLTEGSRLRWLLPGLTALCWVLIPVGVLLPGDLLLRSFLILDVLPLALAVGGLSGALLGVRSGRACVLGLAAASILSLLLLPVLWNTPWFERMFLALYEGFHVTESGFAGLFTIVVYLPASALTTLAAAVVLLERRLKKSGA